MENEKLYFAVVPFGSPENCAQFIEDSGYLGWVAFDKAPKAYKTPQEIEEIKAKIIDLRSEIDELEAQL